MARAPENGNFTDEVLQGPLSKIHTEVQQHVDALTNQTGYTFSDTQAKQEQGIQSLQTDSDTKSTYRQSFEAGLHNSLLGEMYDAFTLPDHTPQEGFTPDLSVLPGYNDRPASEEEARVLQGATSPADLASRWDFVGLNRKREQQMADNPIAAIAGALAGDLPLAAVSFGAGAGAAALGAGARGVLAAEAAAGFAEAAAAGYAYSRNPNITPADFIIPALASAAGGLAGLRSIRRANGAIDTVSGSEGILTRQSKDIAGDISTPTVHPVQVQPGELWAASVDGNAAHAFLREGDALSVEQKSLLKGMDIDSDLKVRISADPTKPASYNASTHTVTVSVPHGANASTIQSIGDVVKLLDNPAKQTLLHELVHAGTVRKLQTNPKMYSAVGDLMKYVRVELAGSKFSRYLQEPEEFVAGLADPEFNRAIQRLEVPKELEASFMAGGEKVAQNASEALSQAFRQHVAVGAEKDASLGLQSQQFYDLNSIRVNTAQGEEGIAQAFFRKLGEKTGFTKHMSLWDRVAYSGPEGKAIADRLFANGAATGARQDSAADQLRLLQVQSSPDMVQVHSQLENVLMKQGISRREMLFNSPRYQQARQDLNERVTQFMDGNSNKHLRGEPVDPVPKDIQPIVESLQQWSENWRKRLQGSGLSDDLPENPWYMPRRYEYSNVRKLMADKGITRAGIRDLFRQAIKDSYPAMPTELRGRVAENIEAGIWQSGSAAQRRTWQEALGVDQLEEALRRTGLDESEIASILENRVKGSESAATRNLKGRTQFDTQARYVVEGKALTLQDLMQKDVVGLLDGYTHSMSGRLALDRVGIKNPRELQDMIDKAGAEVKVQDVQNWGAAIDDGLNQILGIGDKTPQMMRIMQNFASATMLKNSGLYQVVDTATAVYERGLGNWGRALGKEKWMREVGNKEVASRLLELLEDGTAMKDAKFRWLQSQMMDVNQYTKADKLEVLSTNAAQTAMTLNGLRRVTKLQGSLNSRIIINTMLDMLEGNPEAVKYMRQTGGLSEADIKAMQAAHSASPGKAFEDAALRNRFENAGLRLQDTLTQQNRIGEVPAWATSSAAGRVLVGFSRFALAAHNKLLRRVLARDGMYGVMVLAAYQAPLMLMVQTARHVRDGKNPFEEKEQKQILSDTAVNLSVFGILPFLNDLGTGQGQFSNPAVSWGSGLAAAPGRIVDGQDPLKVATQSLPLLGLLPLKATVSAGKEIFDDEE